MAIILELNHVIFWYTTGETLEAVVEIMNKEVTAPRVNGYEHLWILDMRKTVQLVILWLWQ